MKNTLCVLLAALLAALILGSCLRHDMKSAQAIPSGTNQIEMV